MTFDKHGNCYECGCPGECDWAIKVATLQRENAALREAASAASDSLRWRTEPWAKQIQSTLQSALTPTKEEEA